MLQQWHSSQNFQLTAFPCSWYRLSILYESGQRWKQSETSLAQLHTTLRHWFYFPCLFFFFFFSGEKVSFFASWRLTKRNRILHLKYTEKGSEKTERISCRLRRGRKRNLFSASTMLDGVLQLNKLSRGLFLSWSVNAVILGAGAAKCQRTAATSGNTALPLSSPPRHPSLCFLPIALTLLSQHPSTFPRFVCFPFPHFVLFFFPYFPPPLPFIW